MGGATLDPMVTEAARARLRRFIDEDCRGSVGRAASVLGVSLPLTYDVLARRRAVGMKLLAALARETGGSIDEVIGRLPASPAREDDPPRERRARPLSHAPGWKSAVALAQRVFPDVPAWAWDAAGRLAGLTLAEDVSVELAYSVALLVLRFGPAQPDAAPSAPRRARAGGEPASVAGSPAVSRADASAARSRRAGGARPRGGAR